MQRSLILAIHTAILLYSVLASFSLFANDASHIRGALCLLKVDEQLLLVEEVITGKLSLPGGTINRGESPSIAAQRETWEETGIIVTVGNRLEQTDSAYIFDCQLDSSLLVSTYRDSLSRRTVPSWIAPHYGIETKQVILVSPNNVMSRDYRYPSQWPTIKKAFVSAKDQPVDYVDDMLNFASYWQQIEVEFIASMQRAVKTLPTVWQGAINQSAQFIESSFNRLTLTLSMALITLLFGVRFALKVVLLIASSGIIAFILQLGIALPRPYEYLPSIKLGAMYGFSMPNIVSVVMTATGIIVTRQYKLMFESANNVTLMMIAVVASYSLSGVYLGSQYVMALLAGVTLGGVLAWNFIRLDRNVAQRYGDWLFNATFWLVIAVIAGLLSYLSYSSYVNSISVLCLSVALFVSRVKKEFEVSVSMNILTGLIVVVLLHSAAFDWLEEQVSYSGKYSLLVNIAFVPSIMVILAVLFYKTRKPTRS
ncbi:phospholipid phosphatase [Vibrio sp. MACH09]|uniref:NUDIX domain-containing protein n=1 Tax=Vibrio sp. MACH09 TaxID=3025122 RepID=UPI002791AC0E|nr:NUDIX domain-containing protein [Vibrio sp. MACH09]GLO60988.1 phospholipid phosphatase [Vibrio sp. MACH09]